MKIAKRLLTHNPPYRDIGMYIWGSSHMHAHTQIARANSLNVQVFATISELIQESAPTFVNIVDGLLLQMEIELIMRGGI